jgi:hypothetical protein
MKRIIIHWTAGNYNPNEHEKSCYHFLIDSKGKVYAGTHKPEDNENCNDGNYAAHTGGGNTGSIGVAMCGMFNYKQGIADSTPYPLTATQFEACMKKVAQLCKQYNIAITPQTVMTHYEFGIKNPKTTSAGKIDIIYLPHQPQVTSGEVGNYIRNKALWYYQRL